MATSPEPPASPTPPPASRPLRLAAVATSWEHGPSPRTISHAEVILTRWLIPRPGDAAWGWRGPQTTLASVYIEQLHDRDEIHQLAREHDIRLAPTIDDALTLGADRLAVDAVLLIGEHGEYPRNELGQKLYPRKELFDAIVDVYRRCGAVAPMFCDKHFSYDFAAAREMVDTARAMGFMLFGGSSLPHCPLDPPLPPLDGPDARAHPAREVVAIYGGDVEAYGFHSMEMVQSYIERRPGGEAGVERVTCYEGPAVLDALERGEWSRAVFDAATRAAAGDPAKLVPRTAAVFDHADGLRTVHINMERGVGGWALAVRRDGDAAPHAASAIMGDHDDFHAHFAGLARVIEDALIAGRASFPLERTLLATGMIAAAMRARPDAGTPRPTPELAIPYDALSRDASASSGSRQAP